MTFALSVVSIEDMDQEFTVTAAMLVRLCDVVLEGELEPDALHSIGFALMASDAFCWDANEDDVLDPSLFGGLRLAPYGNFFRTGAQVRKCPFQSRFAVAHPTWGRTWRYRQHVGQVT